MDDTTKKMGFKSYNIQQIYLKGVLRAQVDSMIPFNFQRNKIDIKRIKEKKQEKTGVFDRF